ncbi:MAG TPA: response regulator transcription factor [Candidatus Limnocylindrales bacterium]|nr:response regulator transcription factor [Candidatus Limnocylindrales bacterium]
MDDHPVVCAGIVDLLRDHNWLRVVGQAGDGRQALGKARELLPDIVVTDISLPKLNGLSLAKALRAEFPHVGVIILTMHGPEHVAPHVVQSGARGYVCKKVASTQLIDALEIVALGGTYFDPYFSQLTLKRFSDESVNKGFSMTPRERDVLVCIAEGLSNKEIASQLGLGVRTVETHRQCLIQKLNIHTTAGLTCFALQQGLIELNQNAMSAAVVT